MTVSMKPIFILFFVLAVSVLGCTDGKKNTAIKENINLERARVLLDSLYRNYSVSNSCLLRESCPFTGATEETYLEADGAANLPRQYAYLWPYAGTFSAVNALLENSGDKACRALLEQRVLPGLEAYYDAKRIPPAYTSYVTGVLPSDRFYDDNIWVGIDFTNSYLATKDSAYLDKAETVWKFVISGMDDTLGGGIYWCEQKKLTKNTCSNAPASVYAFKLFQATRDSAYFYRGRQLYDWTKKNLQDTTDYLYFDRLNLDGRIGPAKHAYNSGQMMQSAALQYKITGNPAYLADAQAVAKSCYHYFFSDYITEKGKRLRLLKKGDVWFSAVMLRGFIELYRADKNNLYIKAYGESLDYAWTHARDEHGLFGADYSGESADQKKDLLTQAAMVEMYARLAAFEYTPYNLNKQRK